MTKLGERVEQLGVRVITELIVHGLVLMDGLQLLLVVHGTVMRLDVTTVFVTYDTGGVTVVGLVNIRVVGRTTVVVPFLQLEQGFSIVTKLVSVVLMYSVVGTFTGLAVVNVVGTYEVETIGELPFLHQ